MSGHRVILSLEQTPSVLAHLMYLQIPFAKLVGHLTGLDEPGPL